MMRVTLFGTRGSIAAPGPETVRYGGNTSTVEVRGHDGTVLVLDAGTGIRRLGTQIPPDIAGVDVLIGSLQLYVKSSHGLTERNRKRPGKLRMAVSQFTGPDLDDERTSLGWI